MLCPNGIGLPNPTLLETTRMKKIHTDTCPICGTKGGTKYLTCSDHYATGERFDLVRCERCGFICTQDFPDEAEIGRYYESADYVSHSDTRRGLMNKVYHLVRRLMLARKADMVEGLVPPRDGRRVLDIGCGTGYFLATMKERGWQTLGVEKNALARESATTHFGLTTLSDLREVSTDERFDVISLWHVMEHLQDLQFVFARLRTLLAEGGALVVALPNCSSYDAAYYGADWGAYDVPRHLWHFEPATFSRLARREGFKIEKFAPMPFDAFYVGMLSERYAGRSLPFVRGLWRGAVALKHSLRDPKKSSSIIYVLRRI